MARTSIVSSVGAGFSLIARRPASVLIWALVYLTIGTLPYVLSLAAIRPEEIIDFYRQAFTNPAVANNPPPSMVALQRFQGLQMLGGLTAMAIVYTAILRAVVFPEQSSWFSMRLSWAELRTAVLVIILYILFMLVMVVAVIIALVPLIIAVVSSSGGSDGVAQVALTTTAVIVAVLVALAYPAGRLAMAIPMSVGENRFRLFEAWKFTKGYGWQLLLIFLIVVVVIMLGQILLFGLLALGAVSMVGSLEPARIVEFFRQPDWARDAMGWIITACVCWFGFGAVAAPIMVAPWAEAYRRIAGVKIKDDHAIFD